MGSSRTSTLREFAVQSGFDKRTIADCIQEPLLPKARFSCRAGQRVLLMVLFLLSQTGCVLLTSAHIDGEPVEIPRCEPLQPISISATFTFEQNGTPVPIVTDVYRGKVLAALIETRMFSDIDFLKKRDVHIEIVANNEAARGSAYGKSLLSGITLGFIGYKIPDYYDFTLTLTMPGHTPQTVQCRRETLSTGGLFYGRIDERFREVSNANEGFSQHLTETIRVAIEEWKNRGLLCSGSVPDTAKAAET